MAIYFECKIRYDKVVESGAVKRVCESYLVDALTFTEAEARLIESVTPYISGDFSVAAIKKTKIAEIVNADAEKFFLAKVAFISYDERTGSERKTASHILVGAPDIDKAKADFEDAMNGTVSDYELQSLSETQIMEVFMLGTEIA